MSSRDISAGRATTRDVAPAARVPLLVAGFVALALGAAGGLVRLGIALLAGEPDAGFLLFVVGAVVFAAVSVAIWLRQRALHTGLLALGTFALIAANVGLVAGAPLDAVAPSWLAFFVLTIGGERLELSRLVPVPRAARAAFAAIAVALLAVALAAFAVTEAATRITGALMIACALWLGRYDIATRTVRASALTRYIALCLLAGYAWLAVGGGALALTGGTAGGRMAWDIAVHAVMLGFVFSMVFGHAPVILPAVLRIAFPYRAVLYLPLVVLHATLALRVAGDVAASGTLRAWGAAGNAAAIALFIVTAAALVASAGGRRRIGTRGLA